MCECIDNFTLKVTLSDASSSCNVENIKQNVSEASGVESKEATPTFPDLDISSDVLVFAEHARRCW